MSEREGGADTQLKTKTPHVNVGKEWTMCLGNVKGAFLEAGPLDAKFKPLYARQPAGGIPGIDPTAVIKVLGNVCGANDAPLNWYHTFDPLGQPFLQGHTRCWINEIISLALP